MNINKKNSEIYLEKAKIVASIMNLADFMYEKNDLSSRTAAILIYFNLIEYLLCFMVRNIKINIQTNEFEKEALGGKIKLLNSEKINFYEKEKLIDVLNKFNVHRIKITHYIVDAIFDKKMTEHLIQIKQNFDELNKIIVSIVKNYNIT